MKDDGRTPTCISFCLAGPPATGPHRTGHRHFFDNGPKRPDSAGPRGDFSVHHIHPNGDCFYEAVAYALSTDEPDAGSGANEDAESSPTPTCTTTLRSIVANSLTEETMELFRMTHEAGIGGFEFMRKMTDLDALQEKHLVSGRDTSPGACIWANDFCIQTTATHLRVCLHIMDEESGRARGRGGRGGRGGQGSADGATGGGGKRRKTGTFVTIRPETTSSADADCQGEGEEGWRHIVLQRTRRQHYNLIVQRFEDEDKDDDDGKTSSLSRPKHRLKERGIFRTLPPMIQELWGFD